MNLLLCGFRLSAFVYILLDSLRKNRKIFVKMDTSSRVGFQPDGAYYRHSETVSN